VPKAEDDTRKIVARLNREGWIGIGGAKHDQYVHPNRHGVLIVVPRHRKQYPGTAYSIAKTAGWK
jgi:predicted RNA binding protein YcfA (HicA-like mRNA interferase family)